MSDAGLTSEQTMAGILAILAAMREDAIAQSAGGENKKTEVVLYNAGLSSSQISSILGKKPDTVKKTLQRARKIKEKSVNGNKDD